MQLAFIFPALIIGFSGIIAQVLLTRELLVGFLGNELTLGIILAHWVISEALGVFSVGSLVDKTKNKANLFVWLQIAFSLSLIGSIYFSRTFKGIIGVQPAEGLNLYQIFLVSFLSLLPVGYCHGALFSCVSKFKFREGETGAIGRMYAWETAGTMLGGLLLTYLFISRLDTFQIGTIVAVASLSTVFFILRFFKPAIMPMLLACASIVAFVVLYSTNGTRYLHQESIKRQWRQGDVVDYRNSVYGNIVVSKKEGQLTFFYNGSPIITTPYPDIAFMEEFGNFPLAFHSHPEDVLIMGGGAGGLLQEVLKHPVKRVDYLELDPLIIEMVRQYPTPLTIKELADSRLRIINQDPRFFLNRTSSQYDIMVIGISNPADLTANRFFTREFFRLTKKRLKPSGIIALWLPGSLTYLSQELKNLNVCILNTLKLNYEYVRVIPGDYNIYLSSDDPLMEQAGATFIWQRLEERRVATNTLNAYYLEYRLGKNWVDWFMRFSGSTTRQVNLDQKPFAVFGMLAFWNAKFNPRFSGFFQALSRLTIKHTLIFIYAITLVILALFYRKHSIRPAATYGIFTTGFFGMLTSLILIFGFQVFYGYLYHSLGILISVFMAGITAGSLYISSLLNRIKNAIRAFVLLEILIILFSLLNLAIMSMMSRGMVAAEPFVVFLALFFICGSLIGLQFPLATKMFNEEGMGVGQTAGILYGADLTGGWLAGIAGGMIFLPVLGLSATTAVVVLFKLSSLFLLFILSLKAARLRMY